MAQLTCPWCSELHSIRRSRLRLRDWPRIVLGSKPYRCRICGTRFYQRNATLPSPQVSSTTLHKH